LEGERRLNNENYLIIKLEENSTGGGGNDSNQNANASLDDGNGNVKKEEPMDTSTDQNGPAEEVFFILFKLISRISVFE
jgi:hypothetical protein